MFALQAEMHGRHFVASVGMSQLVNAFSELGALGFGVYCLMLFAIFAHEPALPAQLPSVEGMSMMLLEVASLGTPLVSSDIPENATVLPQHALFFKSGDADDLRRKLDWALYHHDEMRDLGRKARRWVMKNYHWDSIVSQYEALYHHIV